MNSILYVEDELDYQILVKRILEKSGHAVHVASTGAEGVAVLAELHPCLIILDINLPDTDGYSLCARLRDNPRGRRLPILMLTVRRRPEEWLKGFSSGADDYMSKPLNPPELVDRVRTCIVKRRKDISDTESAEYLLTQAAVMGNRTAFEVLIQKYRERLLANLFAAGFTTHDAEDVASLAFIRSFEKLSQFRGDASFYSWLYRIAMNESHRVRPAVNITSYEALTQGDESLFPRSWMERNSQRPDSANGQESHLQRVVSCVPKPYRQMLQWRFIRGRSCRAIGKRLGLPTGTVMSRLFRAKQLLRDAWRNTANS